MAAEPPRFTSTRFTLVVGAGVASPRRSLSLAVGAPRRPFSPLCDLLELFPSEPAAAKDGSVDREFLNVLVTALERQGFSIDPGLTDDEITAVQRELGFAFPPDLRHFLQLAVPRGRGFPDWRLEFPVELRDRFDWPLEGLLFDVEHNNFWLPEWGDRPKSFDEAKAIATRHVRAAPTLVPVFSHRYLPSEPSEAGNPVFSVYQTDIIYYGANLQSYFEIEFLGSQWRAPEFPRPIRFWTRLVEVG